ncbi:MAG: chemotaxis protein CheW [Spirochaetales bacterium]
MSTAKLDPLVKGTKESDKLKKIDFKMISFTLSGRDYGINILKVKEIRKAGNFTKVPNTPLYVKGVDNLRGDIIPVIDLRIMFNLPAESKESSSLENIIILRLDSLVLGIIVDTIEKVVGISSDAIQPPHPIFGDINIKYISGVVENDNRLYIILDVDRIFGQPEEVAPPPVASPAVAEDAEATEIEAAAPQAVSLDFKFISENLSTFNQFYVTPFNTPWVQTRLQSWKDSRKAKNLDFQFTQKDDGEEFLSNFYSPFTGQLWSAEAVNELAKSLKFEGNNLVIWNPGCGRGYETYSLAMLMQTCFRDSTYKIWANDLDLLNISTAPSLILDEDELDLAWKEFTVPTKNGLQFHADIKNRVLFEFHDINNMNPFAQIHLVVMRDVLSFQKPNDQDKILGEISEKVRSGGYLLVGSNEVVNHEEWKSIGQAPWSLYQKI